MTIRKFIPLWGSRTFRSPADLRERGRIAAECDHSGHAPQGSVVGRYLGEPRDVGTMVLEIVLEPEREGARRPRDAAADLLDRKERDVGDLGRVGPRARPQRPEIDVDEFVLLPAVVEFCAVTREKSERQVAGHAQLLVEPPPRRRDGALAGAWMSAAGIRPQPARVIFFRIALLQQDPPALVDHEDRERAVQEPGAVDGGLAARPGGAVALVDQDQFLVAHGLGACRRSFTRTALPCERGTSPGALSTTVQVTPTMALRWSRTSPAIRPRNSSSDGAGVVSSTSIVIASIGPSRVSTIW